MPTKRVWERVAVTMRPRAPMLAVVAFGEALAGRTIVVVDDHASMRELLHDTLSSAGARVLCAVNGFDALALVMEQHVDALVSDLRMPTMTGLDLARAIRALRADEKSSIVAIAVSGDDSWRFVDPNRSAMAGFDYHMLKPVEPELLVATVDQLIRRRGRADSGTLPRVGAPPASGAPRVRRRW